MKKHAIIPIFIPHIGCPNDCVFCNQKKITAKINPPSKEDIVDIIERNLKTIINRNIETIEIAFFGGSFTGIPLDEQISYLSIAKKYKDEGFINKIHLSTRPDYIDDKILTNLKEHSVDIIELGVQSFDEDVLRLSGRGHNAQVVYSSSKLIKEYGFELGLQLMIGLPGDSYEKDIYSANEAVKIGPSIARLYPTIIIYDTALYDMYKKGSYTPLSADEAVKNTKDMYKILKNAGINVIRIGLKSTDYINENGQVTGGTYHPAFRQLVESELAKEHLENQLLKSQINNSKINFVSNSKCFSYMIGNNKSNKIYFKEKYPNFSFKFKVNPNLKDDEYLLL
ncbi:elongator complex protein 3 [Anaerovorax odorimutans]|uniref:elongator complex protein 3 n=1 Tax=Anaerovorax odorimutans TaxID=109327 RepID=UPI0003FF7192|nr:radical SAM protein [Anaerovorax odorimutans]